MPLHSFLEELLVEPDFMKEGVFKICSRFNIEHQANCTQGGTLGFFCSHAYTHASDEAPMLLPRALKGPDLVLYSVFQYFGIQIDVLLVIFENNYGSYDKRYKEMVNNPIQNRILGAFSQNSHAPRVYWSILKYILLPYQLKDL